MISLYDYILESLQINEAAFKPIDFCKHDFGYVKNVLTKIQNCQYNNKNKNALTLGNTNDGKKSYIQFDLTTKVKYNNEDVTILNAIDDFIKNVTNKTVEDFNNLFKQCYVTVYDNKDLIKVNDKHKTISEIFGKKSFWGIIYKSDFTGKNSSGASFGQIFESLVCYLYNNYNKDIEIEDLVEKWTNHFNIDTNNSTYNAWVNSSKYTVETICKQFKPENYIAFHIDGHNLFENIKYNKEFENIALIFSGKTGIQKVFNTNKFNNIYEGKHKDKWNAADIVLIKKEDFDYESFKQDLQEAEDGIAFNNRLIAYSILSTDNNITKTPPIAPISLKFIDNVRDKIYRHNIGGDYTDFVLDSTNISNIEIKFGQRYKQHELTGNFIVDGDSADIQIRKQSGDNLSIEAKLSDNKFARGGKGISVIKNDLGIKNNDYFVTFRDDTDIYDYFEKNNFKMNLDKKEFIKLSEKNNGTLKKRICFRGFIGLINYYKHKKILNRKIDNNGFMGAEPLTDVQVIEFTKFIWDACTACPGVYFIIK